MDEQREESGELGEAIHFVIPHDFRMISSNSCASRAIDAFLCSGIQRTRMPLSFRMEAAFTWRSMLNAFQWGVFDPFAVMPLLAMTKSAAFLLPQISNKAGTPNPLDRWRRWEYTIQHPQNRMELEPRNHV